MHKTILTLILAAALGACASTGSEPNADRSEATTAKAEKPKMSCRRDKSTGSRLGERICTPVGD